MKVRRPATERRIEAVAGERSIAGVSRMYFKGRVKARAREKSSARGAGSDLRASER